VWWETRQPNLEKWFVTHHPRCDAPEAQQRLWQLGRNRQELFVQPLANVLSKHIGQLCQQPGLTF